VRTADTPEPSIGEDWRRFADYWAMQYLSSNITRLLQAHLPEAAPGLANTLPLR
jgi:hypothetical protein